VAPSIRLPGGISRYCFTHTVRSASYHKVHIGQLLKLQALTGRAAFAQWSDVFRQDYEPPMLAHQTTIYDPARRVTIAAGERVEAVRLSRTGVVTARKTFVLAATVTTQTTVRSLIEGRSSLRIESGSLTGWWVVASQVHLR
jgi:hypothetical protein